MSVYFSSQKRKDVQFHFLPFNGPLETFSAPVAKLPSPQTAKVIRRTFSPDKDTWLRSVDEALEQIERGALQKVVLGRICRIELQKQVDPFALTSALKRKAENAFVFCRSWQNQAFLGASPEQLFARNGREIFSEAIAGTRKRGKLLEQELLSSLKDLSELEPVKLHLQKTLSAFSETTPIFSETSVLKTNCVQHLHSRCRARLLPNITDDQILTALHPTPALCGSPTDAARSLIQKLEPFERHLFGGVVGWSTPEESQWVVAIRSCFLKGSSATLFSGAGIVKGSDGEKEWEELNNKLGVYDAILVD